jgi:hypothetical protein
VYTAPRDYVRGYHLAGDPLGQALALLANIKLGFNDQPWTNALAYLPGWAATRQIGFIRLTPGLVEPFLPPPVANVIKPFTAVSYDFS